jgi:hypothetical protein
MSDLTPEMLLVMVYARSAFNQDMDRDFCLPIDAGYRSIADYRDAVHGFAESDLEILSRDGILEMSSNPFEAYRPEYRITEHGQMILGDNPKPS